MIENGNRLAPFDERATAQDGRDATPSGLRRLAERGNPDAQFRMGRLCQASSSAGAAQKQALRWFSEAARHGHAQAQYDLGLMLLYGDGCDADTARGMHWLARAAASGHDLAGKLIEKIHREGLFGVAPAL